MNKLLRRIGMTLVGMAMAVGVGVGVSSGENAISTRAAGEETSTLTFASAPTSGNSYNATQSDSAKASYTWSTDSTYISADTDGNYKSIHTGSSNKTCSYQRYTSSSFSDYLIKSISFRAKSNGTNPSCAVTINGQSVGSTALTNSFQELTINNTAEKQGGDLVVNFTINSGQKNIMVSWLKVVYSENSSCEHIWDSGVETTSPTCTQAGVMTYTCTECGATKTEPIAALGHTWGSGTVHNPTCTEGGYTEYECTVCHETKHEDETDALGHTFVNGTCTVCGAKETTEYTFDVTSNPGGWPESNSTTLTAYTYTLNAVNYTFKLSNVKQNSGYLMLTNPAVLGLPAISGKKLVKAVISNSSTCSTSVNVGISDSSTGNSYISGGEAQTWGTKGSNYTYNLSNTEEATVYYLRVTSANAQITQLKLLYEPVAQKTIADTRLTTALGTISATVGDDNWTVNGFVFEVKYEGEDNWNAVSPTYVVTESVPTSYDSVGDYPVHFKVTYKDVDYHVNTAFTASVIDDMTPISSFYDGEVEVTTTATTEKYTYRGTVIAIEGNSYYIQQGSYGILVYGGATAYASGMKVGDLVCVTSKIINYGGYVVESNAITTVDGKTCRILGDGTLPSAPIVTTVSAFETANQSTRITFNGLLRNDKEASITWANTWSQGSSHGVAQVKDSTGATTYLYVSKFLDNATGSAVVAKINQIGVDDTFDVFQGVMAVNTNSSGTAHSVGTKHLSITNANQITIHTPESDPIKDWIDAYMYMNDSRFEGDGTGLCKDQSFYINAKIGLKAVEQVASGSIAKFEADAEGEYTNALARYRKWAIACNDASPFDGKDSIVDHLRANVVNGLTTNESSSSTLLILVAISTLSLVSFGGYCFIRRRKED